VSQSKWTRVSPTPGKGRKVESVVSVDDWRELANSDPERPADGHYTDLNRVPWYARMTFEQRLAYLDWIIAKRKVDADVRETELPVGDTIAAILDQALQKLSEKYQSAVRRRRIELADREPLPRHWQDEYRSHLDSWRWKRTRTRKMVSVRCRCEYPDCSQHAENCHHLHYDSLGFEENYDLEALCRHHHRVRHGRI
jgi:hypothetical protein